MLMKTGRIKNLVRTDNLSKVAGSSLMYRYQSQFFHSSGGRGEEESIKSLPDKTDLASQSVTCSLQRGAKWPKTMNSTRI